MYYTHVYRQMGRMFPWRLIQSPADMNESRGISLSNSVLFKHGKLYDVLRILEVGRTLFPCPLYETWFKMLKVVVPVQPGASTWVKRPPRQARQSPAGSMVRTMLDEHDRVHPWL